MIPSDSARRQIEAVFAALDYAALGGIYCEEGGDAFWDAHRGPAHTMGLTWAEALAPRLRPGGVSLYVGAGVAELPAMLTEVLDLGRSVRAVNLDAEECAVLNDALAGAIEVEALDAGAVDGSFDHLSIVSVLNDPVRYPITSGVSYGRIPAVHVDLEAFEAERKRLTRLADRLIAALSRPGVVTTTFEEVPWILAAAGAQGLSVDADEVMVETAIVGDPIGFLGLE